MELDHNWVRAKKKNKNKKQKKNKKKTKKKTLSLVELEICLLVKTDSLLVNFHHTVISYTTKTRLFKYIENFSSPPKTESFQIKILILFIFLL